MGDTGYIMYGNGEKIRCIGNELGIRENPYFNRTRAHFCSHQHTPNSCEYGGAGMTEGKDGNILRGIYLPIMLKAAKCI